MKASELYELATQYIYGDEEEHSLALDYYRQAARKGYFLAKWALAEHLYLFGETDEEWAEALYWYENIAKKHNYPFAKYKAGYMYYAGIGAEKNEEKGLFWLDQSAGIGESVLALAQHYERGATEAEKKKGLEILLRAHEQQLAYLFDEDTPAELYELTARFYEQGIGTEADTEKAVFYYEKAMDEGSAYAALKLGEYYEEGVFVQQDLKKAFELYKSVSKALSEAKYRLALCYLQGKGAKKDEKTAFELLGEAAYFGEEAAEKRIKEEAEQGNPLAVSALEKLNSED